MDEKLKEIEAQMVAINDLRGAIAADDAIDRIPNVLVDMHAEFSNQDARIKALEDRLNGIPLGAKYGLF